MKRRCASKKPRRRQPVWMAAEDRTCAHCTGTITAGTPITWGQPTGFAHPACAITYQTAGNPTS